MYGVGATAADYDNDGDVDIYLTALGDNRLFRGAGDGTFVDVTAEAGVAGGGFSTSALWFDYDKDGHLDLFVANYVEWTIETDLFCPGPRGGESKSYCTPESYTGQSPTLYRNRGDGTFEDVTERAGLSNPASKALGVAMLDFDGDGWMDLFVANDTQPDQLYRNGGDGTFGDIGVIAGVAYSETGVARAGMGVDAIDYDDSGRPSLIVGNFSNEMIALFHNEGNGLFIDEAPRSAVGRGSLLALTFGCFFFDYDLDGRPDIFALNGHVDDLVEEVQSRVTYAQPALLFRNIGEGRFEDATAAAGPALAHPVVGRGAASGDLDGDGDLDVLVTENNGPRAPAPERHPWHEQHDPRPHHRRRLEPRRHWRPSGGDHRREHALADRQDGIELRLAERAPGDVRSGARDDGRGRARALAQWDDRPGGVSRREPPTHDSRGRRLGRRHTTRARGTMIDRHAARAAMILVLAGVACGGDDAVQLGPREDAHRANNRGIARLEQFDYPAAATAFRDALRLDDTLAIARINLALALYYDQDFEGATMAATEAASQLPSSPQPPYLLGLIARAENRPDDALGWFAEVQQQDPGDVGTNVYLGQIHLEARNYVEAAERLRLAVAEEPYNVTAAYSLGLALARSGDTDEGQQLLEQAQALRATGYAVTFGTGYLEAGRYAEAIASTGAEPELVDRAPPSAVFTVTPIAADLPARGGRPVTVRAPFRGRRADGGGVARARRLPQRRGHPDRCGHRRRSRSLPHLGGGAAAPAQRRGRDVDHRDRGGRPGERTAGHGADRGDRGRLRQQRCARPVRAALRRQQPVSERRQRPVHGCDGHGGLPSLSVSPRARRRSPISTTTATSTS